MPARPAWSLPSGRRPRRTAFAGATDSIAGSTVEGAVAVTLKINGKDTPLKVDPRTTLLDCLRETLHLTGTKKGCDHGQCGACTVHVNGRRVNSCLALALLHDGDEITTIEGLGYAGSSASDAGGVRDVRRLPVRLLHVRPDHVRGRAAEGTVRSSDADVKELMSGNICRCGAYPNIVAAIQAGRVPTPSRHSPAAEWAVRSWSNHATLRIQSGRRTRRTRSLPARNRRPRSRAPTFAFSPAARRCST